MVVQINRKYIGMVGIAVLLAWFTVTRLPLYPNNHLHAHRWASDVCRARGVAVEVCALKMGIDPRLSTENAYFDFCFEHGELKRIK